MSTSSEIIVDFDHTLVSYGDAFHRVAVAHGFVPPETLPQKENVKARIYAGHARGEADAKWLQIQHECYTREIRTASIDPHATAFIAAAEAAGHRVSIVSHKSKTSGFDRETNLRAPAVDFLREHQARIGAASDHVLFAETFAEKVSIIKARRPQLLIDDLESVALHPELSTLNRVLLSPRTHPQCVNAPSWRTVRALFAMIEAAGGADGFTLTKWAVSSKNQLALIETPRGKFVAKIFPETPHGVESAERELQMARLLAQTPGVRVPDVHARFDNAVLFSWLSDAMPSSPEMAYRALEEFLARTRGLRVESRVNDDFEGLDSSMSGLRARLSRLRVDESTQARLHRAFELLTRYASQIPSEAAPGRFILSDFAPGNLVLSGGEPYFIDFEDAGMGDPYRFLCNLALHPRGGLKFSAFERLREELGCSTSGAGSRFPVSYFEWILIILNCYSEDRDQEAGGAPTDELRLKRLEAAWRRLEFFSANLSRGADAFFAEFWAGRDG